MRKMKSVSEVLDDLHENEWGERARRAAHLAAMESAATRKIAAAGFGGIRARAASFENGDLHLTAADAAACARLRQMQSSLLQELRGEFPEIKNLRFGIQL